MQHSPAGHFAVGGKVTLDTLRCLAWGGRVVIVGFASGTIAEISTNRLLLKNAAPLGVYWGEYRTHRLALVERTFREIFDLYAPDVLRPLVRDALPLEQADRKDRGALVVSEREIRNAMTGRHIATVRQTAMCRGDGGFSGTPQKSERPRPPPGRAPDCALTLPTTPQVALVYRLSGNLNPLQADPEFARAAGFPRPILHGLATLVVVCHAAVRLALGGATEHLRRMDCRFTAPVYPGEAIASGFWRTGKDWPFRAQVGERVVALGAVGESVE